MKANKILITGGTGKTGRKVVERLSKLGENVRVSSRSTNPSFDWEKPETWPGALEGIDRVYITFQPDLAVPGAPEIINNFSSLAVEMGIKKLVLLSGRGEKEAEDCEQIVMNSGTDWTIVRASWFFQNFSESFFLEPILAGQVALPRAETLEPFIDTDDIADVVTEVLLNDQHNSEVYELTGPRLLTFKQAIEEIALVTNRNIQFQGITLKEYTEMLKEHQIPEDYIWLINYLFTEVLDGRNSSTTNDIEKVLGRKAKDYSDYVKETAKSGVWNAQVISESLS